MCKRIAIALLILTLSGCAGLRIKTLQVMERAWDPHPQIERVAE